MVSKIQEELSVVICIIGAAGAGLSAATRAKECGAENVLVLEKTEKVGGCTVFAHGTFALGSPVQTRLGLFYNIDELFLDVMNIAHWDLNAKLVRKWYNKSGDIIRWFESKGIQYNIGGGYGVAGPRGYHAPSGGCREMVKTLLHDCQENGVEIRTNTRATKLLTNDEGAVVGVLAVNGDKELKILAKCVIIATGSISNNPELLARFYSPAHYDFHNVHIMAKVPHNTGDGLIMAEEIGANTCPIHTLYIGPQNHPHTMFTRAIFVHPKAIKLTRDGERYQDEAVQQEGKFGWMSGTAQNSIPDRYCYALVDESILRSLLAEVAEQRAANAGLMPFTRPEERDMGELEAKIDKAVAPPHPGDADVSSFTEAARKGPKAWVEGIEKAIHSEVANERAFINDNIDEIAKWIGCDSQTLKATIKEYNTFCKNKHDSDFCKNPKYLVPVTTPPYYVFKTTPGIDTCIGGLRINHRLEVLNKEWKPIKGLYAAGVVAGGWLPKDAYAFPGSEMGFTTYSGYTAGENSVKYVLGE